MDGQYLKWYYDPLKPVDLAPSAQEYSRSGSSGDEDCDGGKEKDGGCFKSDAKQQPEERRKLTITLERGIVPGVHSKRLVGDGVEDPGVCEKMAKDGCLIM